MVEHLKKALFPFLFGVLAVIFYHPYIFSQKLPIPADTIVGLYHPYRDFFATEYPRGVPYKNFLITDPVRQTYIWKELSISLIKEGKIPSWNPYEMAGKPLAGNFQSAPYYPLNIIFLLFWFDTGWGLFIASQTILTFFFSYTYLKSQKLIKEASFLGSVAFSFSGVVISWLTWGTIVHTVLWLPLMLYASDKLVTTRKIKFAILLCGALICSILAGHPQSFFYIFIILIFYFLLRIFDLKKKFQVTLYFFISALVALVLTFFQWLPLLSFVELSARSIDRQFFEIEGWFMPWKNLIQFIAPDYFGNPATLNYFGAFNYGEFVGYIGVIPLLLAFISLFVRNRTVIFFAIVTAVSLIFSLPTGVSSIPFSLNIPLISSAQPTRVMLLISFSLSVLCSFGFQFLLQKTNKPKKVLLLLLVPVTGLVFAWTFLYVPGLTNFSAENIQVSVRNLILPTAFLLVGILLIAVLIFIKSTRIKLLVTALIIGITMVDLLRFGQKFTPFVSSEYLYPKTQSINFLLDQKGVFRIANLDRRIMAPNFLTHYRLQSIEGYDPLYLNSYAEFISALERGKPDIDPPFGFNRIITPHNFNSPMFDFLNVKYVLSLENIDSPKLKKVFEEGETIVYQNLNSYERAFFVSNILSDNGSTSQLFENDLRNTAVVWNVNPIQTLTIGTAIITDYKEDQMQISTYNTGQGFLVVSDSFYPTWRVFIDGVEEKIYKTNHTFRGVFVPKGNHTVIFKNSLF